MATETRARSKPAAPREPETRSEAPLMKWTRTHSILAATGAAVAGVGAALFAWRRRMAKRVNSRLRRTAAARRRPARSANPAPPARPARKRCAIRPRNGTARIRPRTKASRPAIRRPPSRRSTSRRRRAPRIACGGGPAPGDMRGEQHRAAQLRRSRAGRIAISGRASSLASHSPTAGEDPRHAGRAMIEQGERRARRRAARDIDDLARRIDAFCPRPKR